MSTDKLNFRTRVVVALLYPRNKEKKPSTSDFFSVVSIDSAWESLGDSLCKFPFESKGHADIGMLVECLSPNITRSVDSYEVLLKLLEYTIQENENADILSHVLESQSSRAKLLASFFVPLFQVNSPPTVHEVKSPDCRPLNTTSPLNSTPLPTQQM